MKIHTHIFDISHYSWRYFLLNKTFIYLLLILLFMCVLGKVIQRFWLSLKRKMFYAILSEKKKMVQEGFSRRISRSFTQGYCQRCWFFKTIRLVAESTIFLPNLTLTNAPCRIFIERLSLVALFNETSKNKWQ